MKFLRTPDERFKKLKDFSFEPKYAEVPGAAQVGFTALDLTWQMPHIKKPSRSLLARHHTY